MVSFISGLPGHLGLASPWLSSLAWLGMLALIGAVLALQRAGPNRRFLWVWRLMSGHVNEQLAGLKAQAFSNGGRGLSGVVLELGPGFGETMQYYVPGSSAGAASASGEGVKGGAMARTGGQPPGQATAQPQQQPQAGAQGAGQITRLILVEPNPLFHAGLLSKAAELGIPPSQVTILDCTADRLGQAGVADASVDHVVCSLVLCSAASGDTNPLAPLLPYQARAVSEVSRVLKPGGSFRFLEHIHAGSVQPGRLDSSTASLAAAMGAALAADAAKPGLSSVGRRLTSALQSVLSGSGLWGWLGGGCRLTSCPMAAIAQPRDVLGPPMAGSGGPGAPVSQSQANQSTKAQPQAKPKGPWAALTGPWATLHIEHTVTGGLLAPDMMWGVAVKA